jgi:hypothetical protein
MRLALLAAADQCNLQTLCSSGRFRAALDAGAAHWLAGFVLCLHARDCAPLVEWVATRSCLTAILVAYSCWRRLLVHWAAGRGPACTTAGFSSALGSGTVRRLSPRISPVNFRPTSY